jgi:hypothetical protein
MDGSTEKIQLPDFEQLPLSVLHTIWQATSVDLLGETSMAKRMATWAYYVRHGADPSFTMEQAEQLSLGDFDLDEAQRRQAMQGNGGGPDPT